MVSDLTDFTRGRLANIVRDPTGASPIQLDFRCERFGREEQEGSMSRTFDKNVNPKTVTYPQGVVAGHSEAEQGDFPAICEASPSQDGPSFLPLSPEPA